MEIGCDCFCALQLARVDGLPLQESLRFEELSWRGQRALGQELTEPEWIKLQIAEGGWEINMNIFVLSVQPRDFRRVAEVPRD